MESIKEASVKSFKKEESKKNEAKPVKIEAKPVKIEEKPATVQSKTRSKSNYSKQSYRKVARPVMPFASDPTKFYENIRKEKYNRRKTDITQYANAHFQGGVFVNGFPGQSI